MVERRPEGLGVYHFITSGVRRRPAKAGRDTRVQSTEFTSNSATLQLKQHLTHFSKSRTRQAHVTAHFGAPLLLCEGAENRRQLSSSNEISMIFDAVLVSRCLPNFIFNRLSLDLALHSRTPSQDRASGGSWQEIDVTRCVAGVKDETNPSSIPRSYRCGRHEIVHVSYDLTWRSSSRTNARWHFWILLWPMQIGSRFSASNISRTGSCPTSP